MALKFKGFHHPGREYVKVICDICGGVYPQKDTIRVTNKYNTQFGLIVCLKDADEINEQVLPNYHFERPISSPDSLRPEHEDQFAINAADNRLPSAPVLPFAQVNPIYESIDLFWQGPVDPGSSGIVGYYVEVENGGFQDGALTVLSSNTGTNATYYQDSTLDTTLPYIFRVAAINSFGKGPYSIDFYWPGPGPSPVEGYLALSQNSNLLETSDTGLYILISTDYTYLLTSQGLDQLLTSNDLRSIVVP